MVTTDDHLFICFQGSPLSSILCLQLVINHCQHFLVFLWFMKSHSSNHQISLSLKLLILMKSSNIRDSILTLCLPCMAVCFLMLLLLLFRFSRVQLCVTLWAVAHQAPLSLGSSGQEHWSGLPCPPPGDLPNPGIKSRSPALQQILYQLNY